MSTRNPFQTRVVVTGLGTINPIGNTVKKYWENLLIGKSGVRRARNIDLSDFAVKIAGEIDLPEDLTPYFKKKRMTKRLDRYIVLAHIAGVQALNDSGLDIDKDPQRYGVIIGTSIGGLETKYINFLRMNELGIEHISPFYVVATITSMASGYLAKEYNLQGPNFAVNSSCATSNHAIGISSLLIKMGFADAMIVGGSEAVLSIPAFAGLHQLDILSKRNDSPETACRPFDRDRDGYVLAEGAGVLCIEELEHAKKRGAKIYAEITGFGFTHDAYDIAQPHPEGKGAAAALELTLQTAKINKSDVDLINAYGPSTISGDAIETQVINTVCSNNASQIMIHSTK